MYYRDLRYSSIEKICEFLISFYVFLNKKREKLADLIFSIFRQAQKNQHKRSEKNKHLRSLIERRDYFRPEFL